MLSGVSNSFRSRADSAAFWEAWVAAVLTRSGLYVTCMPWEIDGKDHGQSYDLEVRGGDIISLIHKVEVKSVNLTFHNTLDYPFENALVCSQSSFLKKWSGKDSVGRDFLIVSRVTGNVLWIPKGTKVELGVEVHDSTRNETYKAVQTSAKNLRELHEFVQKVKG